jgi:tetratricopeptide (TPR) repeat protein
VLVRNRKTAEQALRDSIAARKDPADRGQVWHSLGNLLSKDPQRRSEAEEAYLESLAYTDDDPASRGERLHSYGNFLAEDSTRWSEAERAYQESLDLLVSKGDKAQTLADWSRLLARFDTAQGSSRAEEYALKGLKLDPKNPKTSGICYQILADIYEARGDNNKAIWALKGVIETDRRQGKKQYEKELQNKLAELRQPAQEQVDNPDID